MADYYTDLPSASFLQDQLIHPFSLPLRVTCLPLYPYHTILTG